MGETKLYGTVIGSCLTWSAIMIIGTNLSATGPFTALTVGLAAASALFLPLARRRDGDLMDGRLMITGVVLGVLLGAVGLGCQLAALKLISPLWVTGVVFCAPLMAAVFFNDQVKGEAQAALMVGFMGLVAMTGGAELTAGQIGGLTLSGLGGLSLAFGLHYFQTRGQSQPRSGLTFWAAVGATIFLIPAALCESATLAEWSLGHLAAAISLGVAAVLGSAAWLRLTQSENAEGSVLGLALAPIIGLMMLAALMGLNLKGWDMTGIILVGLGLLMAGRERIKTAEVKAPRAAGVETLSRESA